MTFEPLTMDGQAAAKKLLAKKTNEVHKCLKEVFNAFPFERSDTGDYASARIQWERTPKNRRHPGDRGVPPGALVFFDLTVSGTRDPRPGHIGISVGGNKFVSTDWPTRGVISVATIEAVEEAWRARYLGWTDVIGGHNVKVGKDPDAVVAGARSYPFEKVVLAPLNLRKQPSVKSATVISRPIPAGKVVNTARTSAGWTPVKYGDEYGWVKAEFAVITSKATRRRLTLRDRPAPLKRAKVKTRLPKGTRVEVLGVHGKTSAAKYWQVRVVKTGQTGWVVGEYLK